MSSPFSSRSWSRIAVVGLLCGVAASSGCTQALLTGAYLVKGVETPAEFKELKGKKTAVVCRPLVELQYSSSSAAQRLATNVTVLLKSKIKKSELVSPAKIEQWADEHEWQDFAEVGKAMKSDYVVGIEIEDFKLYQGQTIYQGRARVSVKVCDMAKGGEVVYEKNIPEIVYPPQGGVPTSEKPEEEFRRQFIGVVSEQVGRLFYGYDYRRDVAIDSTTL
jgi:hypothetical protein